MRRGYTQTDAQAQKADAVVFVEKDMRVKRWQAMLLAAGIIAIALVLFSTVDSEQPITRMEEPVSINAHAF